MATKIKRDIYQEKTDQIIALLESGDLGRVGALWNSAAHSGLPKKHDGKPYRGVNVISLWMAQADNGFKSNIWMTYRQAETYGGNVIKGQKSVERSILFKPFVKGEKQDSGEVKEKSFLMIRDYAVFNVDQIENLPERFYVDIAAVTENPDTKEARLTEWFDNLGADIHHGGNRAFFRPSADEIHMPAFADFVSSDAYYSVLAHECTHWTGGEKRLNRERNTKRFGDEAYAFEELIAELGACFTMAILGLSAEPRVDHAQYLKSWLQVLKNDKKAIFTAASAASNAVDFMVAKQETVEEAIAA
jgi:antirestriction protein ArdC